MLQFYLSILCIALVVWTYLHKRKNNQIKNIVHLPSFPLIGSVHLFLVHLFLRQGVCELYQFMNKIFEKYGDKFVFELELRKYYVFSTRKDVQAILTNSKMIHKTKEYNHFVEWLGHSLFTTSGQIWRSKRKELYSYFSTKTVENSIDIFERHTANFLNALDKFSDGKEFDVHHNIEAFAMDAIYEIAFGLEINSHINTTEMQHLIEKIVEILMERGISVLKRFDFYFRRTKQYEEMMKMIKACNRHVMKIVTEKKQQMDDMEMNSKDATTFLEYLLCISKKRPSASTVEEIQNELTAILFAGLDTSTSSLCLILYTLAKYPDVQEKILNEINTMLDTPNTALNVKLLNSFKYVDMVVKEVWRMYTPVPFIMRTVVEDVEINGVMVPTGSNIVVAIHNSHTNSKNFPEPDQFKPERYDAVEKDETGRAFNLFTFVPGARGCVGNKLAEYELKVLIIRLVQKFKLELMEGYEPVISITIVLKTDNGVWIKIKPRSEGSLTKDVGIGALLLR